MAIYELECDNCGNVIEVWPGDRAPGWCMSCGSCGSFRKIMSKTNFHLKGRVWAKDGYTRKEEKDG